MSVATLLDGVRVVEFAQGVAGPMAACRLGDLSADVVKVEVGDGDWLRRCPPFLSDGETGAAFFALNRRKKSVLLGPAEQRAGLLRKLVADADVFITDRSPGELREAGLDGVDEDRCSFNPRLVAAFISDLGARGPLAGKPGSEVCAQAMAGYTRYVGAMGEPAARLGADVGGTGTAIFAVQAILAALLQVKRTGRGQRVDLSLLNSLLSMKTVHLAAQSDPDSFEGPRVGGAYDPPERGWATADAPITFAFGGAVGANGKPGWADFVRTVGLDRLLDDPRFDRTGRATTGLGPKARELKSEYETEFRKRPSAEIVARVRQFGGFAAPYLTHRELLDEPQAKAMEITVKVDGPAGPVDVLAFPARFSDSQPAPRGRLAAPGEHTRALTEELAARAEPARDRKN